MIKILLMITVLFEFSYSSNNAEVRVCDRCHSHNDYLSKVPLFNALDHGFKSIEVDIVLDDNLLYVAHYWWSKKKNYFIENTYLDSLYKLFKDNNGFIYNDSNPLYLFIDIKSSANETYETLNKSLNNYRPMLSRMVNDSLIQGAVTIILSGNTPTIEYLRKSKERYVFLDGRLTDLGKNISIKIMPLISINWKKEFRWRGFNNIPAKEKLHLLTLIEKVHREEKKIRFWGSPDNIKSWELLYFSDVDLINTDKVIELYNFIISQ